MPFFEFTPVELLPVGEYRPVPLMNYEMEVSAKKHTAWEAMAKITLGEALELWLSTISNKLTENNYRSGLRQLIERGYVNALMTLREFALVNSNAIVDRIKSESKDWSESSRQARAGCYISLTQFLNRRFDGLIPKATPCKEGNAKTFFKIRDKVATEAMTQEQADRFISALATFQPRDSLIAKILLQGGKRVNEGLELTTENINWDLCQIVFKQSKAKGVEKLTTITFPSSVMEELREYIGDVKGLVFRTKTGARVSVGQLHKSFEKARLIAKIPFLVTPHVLRATAITLYKAYGCTDSECLGVSGHADISMMYAYDKKDLSNNASKRVNLVR